MIEYQDDEEEVEEAVLGGAGLRWELPGNYPVFTMLMVIYHYVERIGELLLPPIFLYNIYGNEK